LKEGMGEDFSNMERIAKLLRFASTHNDTDVQNITLSDYVDRMKEGQDKIYYVTADSFAAAKNSPHLEFFRAKGVEVLLLSDRVDEWMLSHLTEFDGKKLQSVAKGDLDLDKLADEEEKKEQANEAEAFKDLTEKIKAALGERVKDVRITHRLTNSPACLVAGEHDISGNLERMLKAAGQKAPNSKPILEINPKHGLLQRLKTLEDDGKFNDWSHLLFDQALLAEGGQLEDPATFVQRLNALWLAL
ncbi:MAG TPA: molecular chaperone HtpG, partial [Burkholderiales bacterium]|nr:molecular chaperone HtpG [Burkholderiales bacterium]